LLEEHGSEHAQEIAENPALMIDERSLVTFGP
jgi:hypothetical protein